MLAAGTWRKKPGRLVHAAPHLVRGGGGGGLLFLRLVSAGLVLLLGDAGLRVQLLEHGGDGVVEEARVLLVEAGEAGHHAVGFGGRG